jgi:hypothetical protein
MVNFQLWNSWFESVLESASLRIYVQRTFYSYIRIFYVHSMFSCPQNKTPNSSISLTLKSVDCDQVKKLLILFSSDFDKLSVSHRLEVFLFLRLQSGDRWRQRQHVVRRYHQIRHRQNRRRTHGRLKQTNTTSIA